MSRTYKDMPKARKRRWRVIKNSMYKKIMNCYSEDIVGRRKDRRINRVLRARLKIDEQKILLDLNKIYDIINM